MFVLTNASVIPWESTQHNSTISIKTPSLVTCTATVDYRFGNEHGVLHKGQLLFLHSQCSLELIHIPPSAFTLYHIGFQDYALTEESPDKRVYQLTSVNLPSHGSKTGASPQVLRMLAIIQELSETRTGSAQTEEARSHYLLSELLELFKLAIKPSTEMVDSIIREALRYINHHYDSHLTREELARLTGFNASYFSRFFQKQVGRSFQAHLTRVRMDKTKQYLLSTQATLNEIALLVGYSDGLYLSRKFKQFTGISPSEYRLQPRARRIATVQYTGDLLALGVQPIAASFLPWAMSPLIQDELHDVLDLDEHGVEEVLRTEPPDLIIAPDYLYYLPHKLEQLEQIAPVMVLPWDQLNRLETVQLIGRIIGREQAAEDWIEHYTALVSSEAERLGAAIEPDETVGLYELWEDGTICIWNVTARAAYNVYYGLNLTPAPNILRDVLESHNHQFIQEDQLTDYAANHMFLVLPSHEGGLYHDAQVKLRERPYWNKIMNNGNSRIYPLKLEQFWCNDALALEKQLQLMVDILIREIGDKNR